MKQGKITHWRDLEKCGNLLFFAELINELLFDYSIPSNRISTLNCHFLCLDALSAIEGIDNNGVPPGSLKPIMEELYYELKKDPSFEKENSPIDFFVKYNDGKACIVNRVSDMNYQELKRTALALDSTFFQDNKYFDSLKVKIIEIVIGNDTSRQKELFRLTKSILTELNNIGYDIRYIYRTMNAVFWNQKVNVDNADIIKKFFNAFDFVRRKFNVIYKIKTNEVKKITNLIGKENLKDTPPVKCQNKEFSDFSKKEKDESFLFLSYEALDPFSAEYSVRKMFEHIISVYRLYDHSFSYKIDSIPCGICRKNYFYIYSSGVNAVEHTKTPPKRQIIESISICTKAFSEIANKNIPDFISLANAVRFHSHSIDSFSQENQLLDFWAIFETVIDISNEHSTDRINQVCRILIPVLKRRYVYSLFEQLSDDIKEFDYDLYKRIVGDTKNKKKIVQKVCEFVLLQEKSIDRKSELDNITTFPLLKERILYYHEQLSTPRKLFLFVEKHADRVKWQVMRIYRNRNLIIHNGKSMPYLGLLIENLHSYVDEFLSYIIHRISKVHNIDCVNQELFIRECKWQAHFSKNNDNISKEMLEECLHLHN